MNGSWALILPLAAALLYAAAALSLKRSAELGAGLWHSAFVSNLLTALAFQGLLIFGGRWQPLALWWQPMVAAILFLSGQVWTLVSLQRGDVSIATPVLGLKIILVASFTTLVLGQGVSWRLWLAAALTTCGLACLNHSGAHREGAHATATILSAGVAAASFALFDVLVQKWSPAWGVGRFLPLTTGMVGLLSFALVPLFPSPLGGLSRPAWRWLGVGSGLFAVQALLFISGIARFGGATASNVIYSSRGVWSIVAVVVVGRWFHSSETHLGASVLRWRLIGATLMFTGIVLVLV
jgi:drug/metabolite transporter (DMT)-like permease